MDQSFCLEKEFPDDDSDVSSAPDEHMDGMEYNEYTRRYDLNIKVLTWSRDSYGLFDYEMRTPIKASFKFDTEKNLVRVGTTVYLENQDILFD